MWRMRGQIRQYFDGEPRASGWRHVPLGDGGAKAAAPTAARRLYAHELNQFACRADVPSVFHAKKCCCSLVDI